MASKWRSFVRRGCHLGKWHRGHHCADGIAPHMTPATKWLQRAPLSGITGPFVLRLRSRPRAQLLGEFRERRLLALQEKIHRTSMGSVLLTVLIGGHTDNALAKFPGISPKVWKALEMRWVAFRCASSDSIASKQRENENSHRRLIHLSVAL